VIVLIGFMRLTIGILLGAAGMLISRLTGRGGGLAVSGLIAEVIAPDIYQHVGSTLEPDLVFVTGTNGKTSTTNLISEIISAKGAKVVSNHSGANISRGISGAYISSLFGSAFKGGARAGVFEVDEAVVPQLAAAMQPSVQVFLNLSRDQLDRYGEIDRILDNWIKSVAKTRPGGERALVVNADDPRLFPLVEGGNLSEVDVITFGLEEQPSFWRDFDYATDREFCICGAIVEYRERFSGHLGDWFCSSCGRHRARPDVTGRILGSSQAGTKVEVSISSVSETRVFHVPQLGEYPAYNLLAAIAAALKLNINLDVVEGAVNRTKTKFGRQEQFHYDSKVIRIWLAKNPRGLDEIFKALMVKEAKHQHLLFALNSDVQDGKDVSWIYDANFESLRGRYKSLAVSGFRTADLNLRATVAGLENIETCDDIEGAMRASLDAMGGGEYLEIIASYTAMLEARSIVAKLTGTAPFWK
jgi:UDP-N-acetylmuramyl tripeptide synthase